MAYETCDLSEGQQVSSHQKHNAQYACSDVSKMEIISGPHADGCKWVGYISAKVCGCDVGENSEPKEAEPNPGIRRLSKEPARSDDAGKGLVSESVSHTGKSGKP